MPNRQLLRLSYLVPRFQNEAFCKAFHMEMSLIYTKMNLYRKYIFI